MKFILTTINHQHHFSFVMGLVWFSTVTTTNLPTSQIKRSGFSLFLFVNCFTHFAFIKGICSETAGFLFGGGFQVRTKLSK